MMIHDTLKEFLDQFVVAYLDDILIYTTGTKDHHVEHVTYVLQRLTQRNLKAKPEKCKFHKQEVEFLGFIIGARGVKIDLTKIDLIQQ